MSFKDYFKKEELSLKEYFEKLKTVNPQVELREKCTKALGDMPDVTFWYKLRNGFNDAEKAKIAKVTGRSIKELFPCKN